MPQKTTKPLPYRQLAIICACRFTEPICFTVIFPFIVQMVRDFDIADEKGVGYYVGMITSCFALAQLLTGIHWGMLSDRIGRRPVILQGLMGTITSILLFGLSKSFIWALLSRSLCGLLNGNVSVLKSMVSELTMDHLPHQRAQAFSMLPLIYGLGTIIGPILGGFLSHPVTSYPGVFGNLGKMTDFLTEYPYFLPCFISASACTCGLIFGYFFLQETHVIHSKKNNNKSNDEEEDLLPCQSSHNKQHYSTFQANSNTGKVKIQQSSTPTLKGKHTPPTLREALTPSVMAICITYGSFVLQSVFVDELFPLFTASSRDNGGLGFSPNEIGIALSFGGVVTLIGQLFVLPVLTKKYGLLRLFQMIMFICIFLYLSQGIIRILYFIPDFHGETNTKFWVWVGLLVWLAIKTVGHIICSTSCTILINNACPRVDTLGAVNGFSQCCASAMRTIGPALCGAIWSASLSAIMIPYHVRINIAFTVLALIGTTTFILSKRLDPKNYETAQAREEAVCIEEEERASISSSSSSNNNHRP